MRRTGALVAAVALLGLAGCGEDEPNGSADPTTPSFSAPAATTTAPAAPTVIVSKGTPCGGESGPSCGGTCTDASCAKVKIAVTGFGKDEVSCTLASDAPGPEFPARKVSGESESEPGWFMGFPGKKLTATCGGVTSPTITWS